MILPLIKQTFICLCIGYSEKTSASKAAQVTQVTACVCVCVCSRVDVFVCRIYGSARVRMCVLMSFNRKVFYFAEIFCRYT